MKILTLNVRSWYRDICCTKPTYWRKRAKDIKAMIKRENPDIILFQELLWPMTWHVLPKGYKKASGLSVSHHVYCRKEYKVLKWEWHLHWAYAKIDIPLWNDRYLSREVISVHSHWDEEIYTKVAGQLCDKSADLIGGDWNNGPDVMEPLMQNYTLYTCGEDTFQNWTNPKSHGNLDYFARSVFFPVALPSVTRLDDFVSDHYPVILTI